MFFQERAEQYYRFVFPGEGWAVLQVFFSRRGLRDITGTFFQESAKRYYRYIFPGEGQAVLQVYFSRRGGTKPAEALVLAAFLGDVASSSQHSLRPFATPKWPFLGDGLQCSGGVAAESWVGQAKTGVCGSAGRGGDVGETADTVVHICRVV